MTHERRWRALWSLVAVLGVGIGMLEWSVTTIAITLALTVLLSWIAVWLVRVGGWWRQGARGLRGVPLPSPTVAGTVMVAGWSYGGITPSLGVLLALVAGTTSPVVLTSLRQASHRPAPVALLEPDEPTTEEERLTAAECLGPLSGLDDHDLCRVWRESFWVVSERSTPATVLRVVILREACLAELERRDEAAVRAWLSTGDWRASGGPEKFMTRPGPGTAGTV
jgi:hypothetical protein